MARIHTGIGLSTKKDPVQAGQEAVQNAKLKIHLEKIDLCLVISSAELASQGMLKSIGAYLPGVPLLGCSSAAIISPESSLLNYQPAPMPAF